MKRQLIGVLAGLALAAAPGLQAADISQELSVSGQQRFLKGAGDSGATSNKFNEYRVVPNGFVLERYDIDVDAGDYVLNCQAKNVNQDDQSFACRGGKPGQFTYKVKWDQIPHVYSNSARTLYTDRGNGLLDLPDALQSYFEANAANFNASIGKNTWEQGAFYTPLQTRDDIGSMELGWRPNHDTTITVSAARRHKSGTQPMGAAFGFSGAMEVAAPTDWVTNEASFAIDYARPSRQASFRYELSDFRNEIPTLTWDNPRRITDRNASNSGYSTSDQTSRGQMAMAPDNTAHNFILAGGTDLPGRSHLSVEGGYAIWRARNPMLPYTVNSAINPTASAGLPGTFFDPAFDASSLDNRVDGNIETRIDVYNLTAKLSNRFFERVKAELEYRLYEQDNKSKLYEFPGLVAFDEQWRNEPGENERPSLRKEVYGAKVDVELLHSLSMDLGYEQEREKATREVDRKREHKADLGFVFRPTHRWMLNLSYLLALRRGAGYNFAGDHGLSVNSTAGTITDPVAWIELPGLRKFDQADRNRNRARFQLQHTAENEGTVTFNALVTDDKYRPGPGALDGNSAAFINQQYGLIRERNITLGTDIDQPIGSKFGVEAYYEWDGARRYTRSNVTNAAPPVTQNYAEDWEMRLTEVSNIGGIALNWLPEEGTKAQIGYDVVASFLHQDPIVLANANSPSPLTYRSLSPTTRTLQTWKASCRKQVAKGLALVARYAYEKFDVNDYAFGDVPLRTNDAAYLGASLRGYRAHIGSIGLDYKF